MNTREHGPTGNGVMYAITVLFAAAWVLHLNAGRIASWFDDALDIQIGGDR